MSINNNSLTVTPLRYPLLSTELFRKLRHLPLPILLSSGDADRFDIITAAPEKILRSTFQDGELQTTIESLDGSLVSKNGNPLEILKDHYSASRIDQAIEANHNNDLPFTGGVLGYFSYELLHQNFGIQVQRQASDPAFPEMLVGIYHWAIIIDHQLEASSLVIQAGCSQTNSELMAYIHDEANTAEENFGLQESFQSNFDFDQYREAYNKVIDYIHAGDCYQVNLTQRFSAPCYGDAFQAFKKLHGLASAPFSAFIEDGQQSVLSFSPERFLQVQNKEVLTQPIKGTSPRHIDPVQDQANLEELKNSDKDKAENLMIVDLLRNDLGRVCKTGSVSVTGLFEAHSFTNVHHLISTVKGELNHADEVFDLLQASFPGGSITGTPKIRSMEIINELETRLRSVYCGSIAYIDFNGNMDSSICIRTLVCDGEYIHCWGGGGVVADSTVEKEYQETLDKISLFLDALTSA